MGTGRSFPVANKMRWNSTFWQLEAIAGVDVPAKSSNVKLPSQNTGFPEVQLFSVDVMLLVDHWQWTKT